MIGSAILVLGTTAFGVVGLTGGLQTHGRDVATRTNEGPDEPAPVISLSLEPMNGAANVELAAPVVRPAGYVLPDDGTEEGSHAGS